MSNKRKIAKDTETLAAYRKKKEVSVLPNCLIDS